MYNDIIVLIVIIAMVFVICYLCGSWKPGLGAIGAVVGGAFNSFAEDDSFDSFADGGDEDIDGGAKNKNSDAPREDKLFIGEEWLDQVIDGKKKVEGRAAEKGAFDKWIGKPLKLYNDKNSVVANVDNVVHYDNLKDFLDKEWELAAPLTKNRKAAETAHRDIEWNTRKGEKFHPYTDERIAEKGGIEAIHFTVKK